MIEPLNFVQNYSKSPFFGHFQPFSAKFWSNFVIFWVSLAKNIFCFYSSCSLIFNIGPKMLILLKLIANVWQILFFFILQPIFGRQNNGTAKKLWSQVSAKKNRTFFCLMICLYAFYNLFYYVMARFYLNFKKKYVSKKKFYFFLQEQLLLENFSYFVKPGQ